MAQKILNVLEYFLEPLDYCWYMLWRFCFVRLEIGWNREGDSEDFIKVGEWHGGTEK